jgi:hypothetical protein
VVPRRHWRPLIAYRVNTSFCVLSKIHLTLPAVSSLPTDTDRSGGLTELFKIGARVRIGVRRIVISMATGYPYQHTFF